MKIQNIVKIITLSVFVCVAGLFFYMDQSKQEEKSDEVLITADFSSEPENSKDSTTDNVNVSEKPENVKNTKNIFVHVCGAVKKAGVYELKEGARICDAITAAGGFKKTANQTILNQAQVLSDGEQVVVPLKEDKQISNETDKMPDGHTTQKISINHATYEELMTLPGIGESKANSIIRYREENGSFQTLEDLKKIQGIKDGVYNKIVDCIML